MTSVFNTLVFKLSVISSLLLFFSIMFGDYLWTQLWILFGLIEFALILLFAYVLIWSIIYWATHHKADRLTYAPFLINVIFLIMVIALPLNFIRNQVKFSLHRSDFEAASQMAFKAQADTFQRVKLPANYQYLSINDGVVRVAHNKTASAVIFYTFLGVPDGQGGFVKVSGGKFDTAENGIFDKVYEVRSLGDNWYYVKGN